MKWVAVVSVALLLIALSSCKGGNNTVIEQDLFSPEAIQQANDSRLNPAAGAQLSEVDGKLTITGFTLLDSAGVAVPDGPSAPKASARLLDPGDDILSETIPGADGTFQLSTSEQVSAAVVEIEFRVEDDVNGDGEPKDTIIQHVPVALEPGRVVTLELDLSKGQPSGLDSNLAAAPQGSTGEYLVTNFTSLDANGTHEDYYGTFFAAGSVVYDTDHDQFLELGDDVSSSDSNNDGWADSAETLFDSAPAAPATLEGVITSVNTAEQRFTVRQTDGTVVTVNFLTFAALEVLGEDGQFVGPTSLDPHLVGMQAYIEGTQESGAPFAANWVVVHN